MSTNRFHELSKHPPLFALAFVVLWLVVTAMVAYTSGWPGLAERFRATQPASGERFRFVSGSMGPASFGSCLFVTVGETGLHLSILFAFRFCCPPLFIPWSAVESVEEKRSLFLRSVIVRVRDHWATLALWGRPGQAIRDAYARASLLDRQIPPPVRAE
jgi:hypothetical protein